MNGPSLARYSAMSSTRCGCNGMKRSLWSLPTGMRSQGSPSMIDTASASRAQSSPTRMPVRASMLDTEATMQRGFVGEGAHELGVVAVVEELRQ